jgi:hypothetical protein
MLLYKFQGLFMSGENTVYNLCIVITPFLFIKNERLFISSEGFSTLEKKRPDMLSEGNVAHPVGCDSPLQIVMAGSLAKNFLGRGQPSADNWPELSEEGCHTQPDHSAE